jgi:hypothetical protein
LRERDLAVEAEGGRIVLRRVALCAVSASRHSAERAHLVLDEEPLFLQLGYLELFRGRQIGSAPKSLQPLIELSVAGFGPEELVGSINRRSAERNDLLHCVHLQWPITGRAEVRCFGVTPLS